MDYLRVFQGRWRGRSCLVFQWKIESRFEATICSLSLTRNGMTVAAMKKQPDGEILFFSNIIRFNSPSSWSHWCRCTLRTLFKKVTLGSVNDWNWCCSHISNNKLMRSISFIVNENLEKPPLTLLQPKASPRTNATQFLEIAYNGWRMVNAPEVRSVERNTTLRKLWNQRKRDRFSVQFSKKEFDGWKEAERYKSFRKRTPADVIRFQEGRSTAEPVADDEKKKLKIDFRVQGIPQAAVEQEEKANTRNWKG